MLKGCGLIALGLAILIGGGSLAVAWIVFCFGSVVIGVVLLVLAPGILFMPLVLAIAAGQFHYRHGCAILKRARADYWWKR